MSLYKSQFGVVSHVTRGKSKSIIEMWDLLNLCRVVLEVDFGTAFEVSDLVRLEFDCEGNPTLVEIAVQQLPPEARDALKRSNEKITQPSAVQKRSEARING